MENVDLINVPIEVLIAEVRKRQTSKKLSGKVIRYANGTSSFEIDTFTWPVGAYNVSIECIEDLGIPQEKEKG